MIIFYLTQKEIKETSGEEKSKMKPKIKVIIKPEPEAGPSGLTASENQNSTVIEKTDCMLICKYKLPSGFNLKPKQPYEVRWGEKFLNTLLPNCEKGILKKPCTEGKGKSRLRFSQTTVYYFERAQPQSTISLEGDLALDMEQDHFYSSLLPIDEYEGQKEIRQKRNQAALDYKGVKKEGCKMVLQINSNEKDIILHTVHVPAEFMEEDSTKVSIVEKVKKGCSCNLYCDPDLCECNLNGKQCEVFKDNFPCGCKLEYCKNANGRRAYNDKYEQKNVLTVPNSPNTSPTVKEIKCGRINKRKQLTPIRYKKH